MPEGVRYADGGGLDAELEEVLDAGPAACGYADQCWTLARVAEQAWRRFGVEYTLAGMDVLLHRIGWSVQVPGGRAGRGEDRQVAGGHLAGYKSTAADLGAWLCFQDESGQGLRPPKGRTWGPVRPDTRGEGDGRP
jgi:hypothetical protein